MKSPKYLTLSQIQTIGKSASADRPGYEIKFLDGRTIHLTKRRTIVSLLVLIHKGVGAESDIAAGNSTIPDIRKILGAKLPEGLVQDSYGDANKPFSELWNEEGFTFIDNTGGDKVGRSQGYRLDREHHDRLFEVRHKALRKAPTKVDAADLLQAQHGRCNFCGSLLFIRTSITTNTFARDHRRVVADHRHPVEKGGGSDSLDNYQLLCFYCNKSKWQICNICTVADCKNCALAFPETTSLISPTKEDVRDRMSAHFDNRIPSKRK
ncbi:HNH endonuclease [Georgfuchsia toluolica]|uniref:HNH endonuclease n=1 Tax=Georgfuchsia toluolica TaxID=424218 RepID=UPI001C73C085|nr:HNH endonuclease [Georgfuchsia toluolica]